MNRTMLGLAAAIITVAGCAKDTDKASATTVDSTTTVVKESKPAPVNAATATPATPAATATTATPDATGANLALHLPAITQLLNARAPADAKRGHGIGHNALWIKTERNPKDDDNIWVDQIDMAGDGVTETADLVVSDDTRTAYAYAKEAVPCKNGTMVQGAELMAVYRKDNLFKRPVGSGWYATELAPGQCGATQPSIWGARFDANGKVTSEGFATLDPKSGDLLIVTTPAK